MSITHGTLDTAGKIRMVSAVVSEWEEKSGGNEAGMGKISLLATSRQLKNEMILESRPASH